MPLSRRGIRESHTHIPIAPVNKTQPMKSCFTFPRLFYEAEAVHKENKQLMREKLLFWYLFSKISFWFKGWGDTGGRTRDIQGRETRSVGYNNSGNGPFYICRDPQKTYYEPDVKSELWAIMMSPCRKDKGTPEEEGVRARAEDSLWELCAFHSVLLGNENYFKKIKSTKKKKKGRLFPHNQIHVWGLQDCSIYPKAYERNLE